MSKVLPYIAILAVILFGLYNAMLKESNKETIIKNKKYIEHKKICKIVQYKDELSQINKVSYIKEYIISVINNGSSILDFPGGVMEGGFAPRSEASNIACYVLELSNKKCKKSYTTNASLFYTSNCAGCHGEKGKGINGSYPDLTREKLLGIAQREEYLKSLNHKESK